MKQDQAITVTVKPEIDREAVEEAAQLAADLFLSSFAVAVLEGVAAVEPPEEVLARVKAETLEKAAEEAEKSDWHRSLDYLPGTHPTDASEPVQTLADLTPCLGDRVAARWECESASREEVLTYGWTLQECYGWRLAYGGRVNDEWTVLEHLPPVTPEEPPVGAGMLVDSEGDLWRRGYDEWLMLAAAAWGADMAGWLDILRKFGPLRPATPADLARHGVDEQGEPVGKGGLGEQITIDLRPGWSTTTAEDWRKESSILRNQRPDAYAAAALCDALADAIEKAGDRG